MKRQQKPFGNRQISESWQRAWALDKQRRAEQRRAQEAMIRAGELMRAKQENQSCPSQ